MVIEEEQWAVWSKTLGWAQDIAKKALRTVDKLLIEPCLTLEHGDVVQLPLEMKIVGGCLMIVNEIHGDGTVCGMIPMPSVEGSWGVHIIVSKNHLQIAGRARYVCEPDPESVPMVQST
jgi:hypothetical protein